MEEYKRPHVRTWPAKFRDAFDGLKQGVWDQSSFYVHFAATAAVIVAGFAFGVSATEWCVLLLCVTVALTAEMFNSALESLARAITDRVDPHVGRALNIGSAAVLMASIGAVIVGSLVFINRLAALAGWW